MSGMIVEMLLKLVDQLSGPLKGAEGNLDAFGRKAADANRQLGQGFDDAAQKIARLEERMSRIAMAQMGFRDATRIAHELGKPIEDATAKAVQFEKQIESIARSGDRLDLRKKIGEDILAVSKAANVPWEQIAAGRRHLVGLGGGEYLDKIAPVEKRLGRLAYASEADPETLYGLLERYMKVGRLSPEKAMAALEQNYLQGKRGAYELKDLARGMPELLGQGVGFGLTGAQAAADLPAILQILRQMTGSAGEANTRLKQGIQDLTAPGTAKRIKEELGVDVFAERAAAIARGENPLLAVTNRITDALRKMGDAAGTLDNGSERIVGGDPEKMGEIARNYYFRAFLDAFGQLRGQLKDFQPTAAEAAKQVEADFNSRVSTTAGSIDKLGVAAEQNALKIGETQLALAKSAADRKSGFYEKAGAAIDAAPGATSAGFTMWNMGAKLGEMGGRALEISGSIALAWLALQKIGVKYPTLGAIGENALGAAKGAVKAPIDIVKGLAEGAASEAPVLGNLGRGLMQNAGKGLVAGVIGAAGEYAIDKGFDYIHRNDSDVAKAWRESAKNRSFWDRTMDIYGEASDLVRGRRWGTAEMERYNLPRPPSWDSREAAAPRVDTKEVEAAQEKASEAGQKMQSALNVTTRPEVDTSAIDGLISKIREAGSLLSGLESRARQAAASVARGSGVLHDGYEAP